MKKWMILIVLTLAFISLIASEGSEGSEGSSSEKENKEEKIEGVQKDILMNPDHKEMKKEAPETFKVKFVTSQGDFVVQVHREWSPHGADRFYNLVRHGFYNGVRFFRVLKKPRKFMAQFGINGDPDISKVWGSRGMPDDPVKQKNLRGFMTYAKTGAPNSRSTQLFINYTDNSFLDNQGFAPFAKIIEGMDVVDKFYGDYGEGAPRGHGPSQELIQTQGNKYLKKSFPKLDWVKTATLVE